MKSRRIALIHDWLTGMRGGEKVLAVLCRIFPSADLFTLVHLPGKLSPMIERHKIQTSPLQRFPNVGRYYRHLLPLMPWAIERFDFSGYDLLISTSHCVAKGAIPPAGVPHYSYCHTPMRYIWDQFDDYFGPGKASLPARMAMNAFRGPLQRWDVDSSARVTRFLANSKNVQERIQRIYHRDSDVLYPPVSYDFFSGGIEERRKTDLANSFYLIVSALAPYKRVDIAIEAFRRMGKRLVIIGDGQDNARLRALAGADVRFLGWRENEALRSAYAQCRALVFPGIEDFGIVPLEAMAAGAPVIAFGRGGALETVVDGATGVFFPDQTTDSLIEAVERFERTGLDAGAIQAQARRFSEQTCEAAFRRTFVEYQNEMS
jgi:glycosyltransferase involved in cell wall biosynthesis